MKGVTFCFFSFSSFSWFFAHNNKTPNRHANNFFLTTPHEVETVTNTRKAIKIYIKMNRSLHEVDRQLDDGGDLGKSSVHGNNSAQLGDLLCDITSTAEAFAQEREKQKVVNKIMLVNKDTMVTHHGTIMANYHRKRSKPRRQSGDCMANVTEETFKITRPLLPRDDSIVLLKQNTMNAIPIIVPLVPADKEESAEPRTKLLGSPLSRIRRRKPRLMSGATGEQRPELHRDDSLLLTKKKLAGAISIELDAQPSETSTQTVETLKIATNIVDMLGKKKQMVVKKPPTRSQTFHGLPSVVRQQGFVRQNSFSPACA